MIKIIFLDIDGVIATSKSLDESGFWSLTKECESNLGVILEYTDAKLVISSSWRKHTVEDTIEYFKEKNFKYPDRIIGITLRAYQSIKKGIHLGIPRGVEIKQWIDTHIHSDDGLNWEKKKIGIDYNYVILDDDTDMLLEQKDHFVNCNPDDGLTLENVRKAINILNKTL